MVVIDHARIKALESQKAEAIEAEDFLKATELKEMIARAKAGRV